MSGAQDYSRQVIGLLSDEHVAGQGVQILPGMVHPV